MNKLYFYCLALFVAPTFSAFGQTQPSQDENGYYLIESAEHLKWFRDQVNASEHEQVDTNGDGQINMDDDTVVRLNAKLTADIDLGGESWTPIGEYNNGEEPDEVRFGGYFDGQGHVIKGLNVQPIDGRQSYGLFGYVAWGVVKNLGIVGGTVTSKADDGQEYTGAISGMLSYGRIENCFSTERDGRGKHWRIDRRYAQDQQRFEQLQCRDGHQSGRYGRWHYRIHRQRCERL